MWGSNEDWPLLHPVMQWRAAPDADGQVATNKWLTDKPRTMPRPNHAAIDQTHANARGAFILGESELTLPAMGCVPATLLGSAHETEKIVR